MFFDRRAHLLWSEFLDAFALERMRTKRSGYRDVDAVLTMASTAGTMSASAPISIESFKKVVAKAFEVFRGERVDRKRSVERCGCSGRCVARCFQQRLLVRPQDGGQNRDFLVPRSRKPTFPSAHGLLRDTQAACKLRLVWNTGPRAKAQEESTESRVSSCNRSVTH